jgi:transposase
MGGRQRIGRKRCAMANTAQRGFDLEIEAREPAKRTVAGHFLDDDPRDQWIGDCRLEGYLRSKGLGWIINLRAELEDLDYSGALVTYEGGGRKALHPRTLIGLIIYGVLYHQSTLRGLEELASRDVGAWWICGGHQPDHSTIGKFIQQHAQWLSEDFFTMLVKHLVGKLHAKAGTVAGDGTVIEAASSHYRALRAEAAREAAQAQLAEAAAHPEDQQLKAQAVAAAEVERVATERLAQRQAHGGEQEAVLIVVEEVEAVVQRGKDGRNRPSYKPSMLRHESGLIVAQYVHGSSETAALVPMLNQHQQVFGSLPLRMLLDAGYHSLAVLELAVQNQLDLLCPSGKRGGAKRSPQGQLGKGEFGYLAERDVFQCPAGRELNFLDTAYDRKGQRYRRYRGRQCADCPLRSGCTTSRKGRTVRRYDGDELKEAMAQVMSQRGARQAYRQRGPLAERPFAEQRERQGLRRFRRRGLAGARVEYSLHCVAFNLKLVARGSLGLQLLAVTVLCLLTPGQPPTVAALLWSVVQLS